MKTKPENIVILNGEFMSADQAFISPFDRGFLFADSVYEVTAVLDGALVDFERHYERLIRSCAALNLPLIYTGPDLRLMHQQLVEKNNIKEGMVYMQISRGSAPRDFLMPADPAPTLFMFATPKVLIDNPKVKTGLRVMTMRDERWRRRDIKTTQLLSQSWGLTRAREQGCDDVWFVMDGFITEGSSNNAFILTQEGQIITRPVSEDILPGITRRALLECVSQNGFELIERPFRLAEAQGAKEAFMSSATAFILPVVDIDGAIIGTGKPGPVFKALRDDYIRKAQMDVG